MPFVAGESVSLIGSAAKLGAQRANAPRILARDDDHLIFTCERLFTMIWKRETMLNAVNDTSRFITEFSESLSPKRIGLLTLIEVSAGMPSTAARAALAKLMKLNTPFLIRSAVGYEGTGFRGAAFRGVSTGIAVLSNHQFPHRIFAGVEAATDWLAEGMTNELDMALSGPSLARTVQQIRRLQTA